MKKLLARLLALTIFALALDLAIPHVHAQAQAVLPTSYWAIVHAPAAAAQATVSRAADTNGRHFVSSITVCVSTVAAQTPLVFNLRDGATGAGTVLWTTTISTVAGNSWCQTANVSIIGSKNTAMTLESAAAPAGTNFASVSLNGFTTY
jgi:hypothetical protein